jgi:hypothetical protein
MVKRTKSFWISIGLMLFLLAGAFTFASLQSGPEAYAGASSIGNKDGADVRALVSSNGSDRVRRIIYFEMDNHQTGGANTPVASGEVCGMAGMLHYAEVKFQGTLTGSNPTLAIKWQNSKDNGQTWSDVGTWTQINATVTPAIQSQTVADLAASTAVVYGDCWRVTYTMGAGGAGNFSVTGIEK